MTHAEALTIAREHVEKMATNARGYQDGATLAGKVAAVETFARFLMEGAPDEIRAVDDAADDTWRALLRRYVEHVNEVEGTDFLTSTYPSTNLSADDVAAVKAAAYDEPVQMPARVPARMPGPAWALDRD